MKIEKAKKADYATEMEKRKLQNENIDQTNDQNQDSDDQSDKEEDNEKGKYLGPLIDKSSNVTLNQWIWEEATTEMEVKRARKRGWKLLKISKAPKVIIYE